MTEPTTTAAAPAAPAPALLTLLRQINDTWPEREKAWDGIMGDAAHQARVSDHNLGDALDVTRGADDKSPPLEQLAEALLRDPRVHYTIFDRKIRNLEFEDGAARPYDGVNPHDHHMHVSVHHDKRDDTGPWDLAVLDAVEQKAAREVRAQIAPSAGGAAGGVVAALVVGGVLGAAVLWRRRGGAAHARR
jgi:hypothetical protein